MLGPEGGAHPQYTRDGQWFWTGAAWIPASQVLGKGQPGDYQYHAPALPRAPRPVERLARWPVVTAAALLMALVLSGVGDYVLAHRPPSSSSQRNMPSAASVLRSPYTHHVRSATFTAVGTAIGTQTATGEIFFSPQRSYEITEQINGYFAEQFLDIGGYAYQRDTRHGPWQLQPTYNGEYFYLDWDGGPVSRTLSIGGPVKVDGHQAWHLWDGLGDEWWIGVGTGRPLAAVDLGYRYTFSNWGKAPRLHAPPASDVATQVYHGRIGQALQTPAFGISVASPQVTGQSGPVTAPPGYRYLSLQVTVTNLAAQSLGVPLGQPVVTSPGGGEYWQNPMQESQDLPDGTRQLAPGASESGTLVFDVEKGVNEVRLLLSTSQLQPDPTSTDYLVVITVSL